LSIFDPNLGWGNPACNMSNEVAHSILYIGQLCIVCCAWDCIVYFIVFKMGLIFSKITSKCVFTCALYFFMWSWLDNEQWCVCVCVNDSIACEQLSVSQIRSAVVTGHKRVNHVFINVLHQLQTCFHFTHLRSAEKIRSGLGIRIRPTVTDYLQFPGIIQIIIHVASLE